MIRVRLTHRLGNQMFQYAAALEVAERLGVSLEVDPSYYWRRGFWRDYQLWRFRRLGIAPIVRQKLRAFRHRGPMTIYQEADPGYQPAILEVRDNTEIRGFNQSDRYFPNVAPTIRALFDLRPFLDARDTTRIGQRFGGAPLASVHVRRGDYVGTPMFDLGNTECFLSSALHLMAERVPDVRFVVLSDDPEWCRALPLFDDFDADIPTGERDPFADLALIAWCQHHIIANSSFSWWGAWLGDDPQKIVVMPDRWLGPTKTRASGWTTAEFGTSVAGWIDLPV